MAFDISCVRSVPEAPTSVPAMISALLDSTKPVAAAARPVKELSSEITTGMSAPPIGSTAATPISSAITHIGKNSDWSIDVADVDRQHEHARPGRRRSRTSARAT